MLSKRLQKYLINQIILILKGSDKMLFYLYLLVQLVCALTITHKMLELQNSVSNYWRSKMKNVSVQNIYL